jgi:hypothetical protein
MFLHLSRLLHVPPNPKRFDAVEAQLLAVQACKTDRLRRGRAGCAGTMISAAQTGRTLGDDGDIHVDVPSCFRSLFK